MERAGMRPPSGSQVSARPPPVSNPRRATMPRRMRTPRRLATLPRVRLLPASLPLMLPTLVEEVPRGPGWLFELKWDGVRLLALREQARVELWARSGARMTERYPEIAVALAPLAGGDFALDGEVVALDAAGRPSFERLQRRMHLVRGVAAAAAAVPVTAYFYDCLALFGRAVRARAPLGPTGARVRGALFGVDERRARPPPGVPGAPHRPPAARRARGAPRYTSIVIRQWPASSATPTT